MSFKEKINMHSRVEFEKPDLYDLTQKHTVVDMHFHSRYSDGVNLIKSIVGRAKKLGIGIAVTDHNDIRGSVRLDAYKDEILTVPGIEVTSKEGAHVLIYFYDIEELKNFYETKLKGYLGKNVMASSSLRMEEIIVRAKEVESLVIFPHPHSAIYTGVCNPIFPKVRLSDLFDMADGVEVINAGNLKKWNLQCAVLGFNLGKSMIGGSDGHQLNQMGKAVTCTRRVKNRAAFLDAIRDNRNWVIGKEIDLFRKVASNGYKIRRSVKNYPHLIEKNVRFSYTLLNSKTRKFRDSMQRKINPRLIIGRKSFTDD
jgi:predicted metal-dependent phosphoesterase TrpH